ncbi:hypothetical protein K470DRAFT_254387 [Piedraia hortae CBS 480.64]|uniref:tRNA-splicing endonuclease subunit Sen34 n=1 Tax=Piedraia hortae CBS 480.64 TaxID=1314780 RepID=A0A6A7CAM7_9PEZI|nr:hypothetical protein K470DRAFT_254387 [Piedraia hortae CBS 480.64]
MAPIPPNGEPKIAIYTLTTSGSKREYLVHDINSVSTLRSKHHMTGVLTGQLPQAPQQNVFSGLPLRLMPEEARYLVEKGAAHLVDDAKAHTFNFLQNGLGQEQRDQMREKSRMDGMEAARAAEKRSKMRAKNLAPPPLPPPPGSSGGRRDASRTPSVRSTISETENWNDIPEDFLNTGGEGGSTKKNKEAKKKRGMAYGITPMTTMTSTAAPAAHEAPLPEVENSSYALFKFMHDAGYFLSPGLRFGCRYLAYPGDPLRFHSHFLCEARPAGEGIELRDIVGGGRLGTGVKKAYLVASEEGDDIRPFCIEWAGM